MKLEDLRKIREQAAKELSLRSGKARVKVIVGMGTSGIAAGARDVLAAFVDEISKRDLRDVMVTQTGERGLSSSEPVVEVREADKPVIVYGDMTAEKARRVVTEHIVNGNPVSEYTIEVREG
ncbi:(2Fe-2S) ferredoxin domain-containing protein [Candidatus Bipolaricaulota bacterium]|nr:(2Fe-2S) ferredoxin domain-containing protein [Candidatus Bipolaricaulota bacterium]